MISEEHIFSDEERLFIEKHLHEKPADLALKFSGEPRMKILIGQIKARQQIRKKLPEWYHNLDLVFPTGLPLEQCSSQETAKLKASLISGRHLLDITGGLGIDTYYLSQSFQTATYVEKDPELAQFADYNFKALQAHVQVKITDGLDELSRSTADVVYVDPHRRNKRKNKMVALKDCEPDVTGILRNLTEGGRLALVKASPMLDIGSAIKELERVEQVWVISHRNECKELIFLLNRNASAAALIKTFNLVPDGIEEFGHSFADPPTKPSLSDPKSYLYEPNVSVLKAGAQDFLAEKLQIQKLHPHSHLYTSENLHNDFPGKKFKVKQVLKPWDKSLRSLKLNVISRNFPAKADLIEKKLRLSPSDTNYLMATKLRNGDLRFILCELAVPS